MARGTGRPEPRVRNDNPTENGAALRLRIGERIVRPPEPDSLPASGPLPTGTWRSMSEGAMRTGPQRTANSLSPVIEVQPVERSVSQSARSPWMPFNPPDAVAGQVTKPLARPCAGRTGISLVVRRVSAAAASIPSLSG